MRFRVFEILIFKPSQVQIVSFRYGKTPLFFVRRSTLPVRVTFETLYSTSQTRNRVRRTSPCHCQRPDSSRFGEMTVTLPWAELPGKHFLSLARVMSVGLDARHCDGSSHAYVSTKVGPLFYCKLG